MKAINYVHSRLKRPKYQQGGLFNGLFQGLDFDSLSSIADSGLFTKDFSFEKALGLGLGNLTTGPALAGALSQDNPQIYTDAITGMFNQRGATQIAQADPSSQQLNEAQSRERIQNLGRAFNSNPFTGGTYSYDPTGLNNRLIHQRDRNFVRNAQQQNLQTNTQNAQQDLNTAGTGLESLFSLFSNLFQFQDGGFVSYPRFRSDLSEKENAYIDGTLNVAKRIVEGKKRDQNKALKMIGYGTSKEMIKRFQHNARIFPSGKMDEPTRQALAQEYYNNSIFGTPELLEYEQTQQPPGFFQSGGVSKLGYSVGSPYQNRSHIDIPGNNITMHNTAKSLYLIPNNGSPVMAPPFSGNYHFPGATRVREVPIRQYGGEIPAVAQLEEGELVALADASIVKPKADKKHRQMKRDEVTDILPAQEAYVFSDDPKMRVTRKEAENISLGYGSIQYQELENDGEKPEEILLSRFFKDGEKKLTPSELLRRVQKEYPISDEKDIFAQRSSFRNKESRVPYIQALQYLTEKKKAKKNPEVMQEGGQFELRPENPFAVSYTEMLQSVQMPRLKTDPDKGYVSTKVIDKTGSTSKPQKAQLGELISVVPSLINSVIGQFQAGKMRRDAERAFRANEADLRQEALRQQGYLGLGTGVSLAALGAMNPVVEAPQYDPRFIQAFPQRLSQSLFDVSAGRMAGANRPFIDSIFANTGDYSRAVNALAPIQANTVGAMANLGMQAELQNLGLRQNYLQARDQLSRQQVAADTDARNATTSNRNALLGQTGAVGTNYFNQQGAISSGLTGSLINNRLGRLQAVTGARQYGQQALGQGLGALSAGLASPGFQSLFSGQSMAPSAPSAYGSAPGYARGMMFSQSVPQSYYQPAYQQGAYHNQYLAPTMPSYGFPYISGYFPNPF